MLTFIERLNNWKDATLGKLKQRSWKIWATVVIVGYIILEVIRSFVSDAGTLFLVWAYRGIEWLAVQPMGVGGLAIVIFVLILTGSAWFQTRPKEGTEPEGPRPLPEQERRLVQDLRTIWNRHGTLAIGQLSDILRDSLYELKKREFWAELLRPVIADLDARRTAFESVLEPSKHSNINLVRDRFNELYASYLVVMKWVAVLQVRDLLYLPNHSDQRLQVWRQNHRDMINRLQDLNADPEHRGTLKIFVNWIDDPAFRVFFREAEMSPEWLALARESEPRSANADEPASPEGQSRPV
jgi:hypothetical protein